MQKANFTIITSRHTTKESNKTAQMIAGDYSSTVWDLVIHILDLSLSLPLPSIPLLYSFLTLIIKSISIFTKGAEKSSK